MHDSDNRKALEPTIGDGAYRIGKALASAVPLVGGPAAELFSTLFSAPLEKRRDEWLTFCLDGLKRLENEFESFKVERLAEKDAFLTTFIHAARAAISNHSTEKRKALRNVVLNSASPVSPDEDMQLMFINMIDAFTSWHLRLMLVLDDTWGWKSQKREEESGKAPNPYLVGPCPIIESLFPELKGRQDFYDHLLKDLVSCGLLAADQRPMSLKTLVYNTVILTPMGREFRKFITSPIDEG